MSAQIQYAYRKGNTWLYRRNYPKDIAAVLGSQALKQSLKTSDVRTARVRAAEVNARYEAQVQQVLSGAEAAALASLQPGLDGRGHPSMLSLVTGPLWSTLRKYPSSGLNRSLQLLLVTSGDAT